jgi:hypothetical protein
LLGRRLVRFGQQNGSLFKHPQTDIARMSRFTRHAMLNMLVSRNAQGRRVNAVNADQRCCTVWTTPACKFDVLGLPEEPYAL